MDSVVLLSVLLSALHTLWTPSVQSQSLPERNALCSEDGCFVVYFQRKTFLEAWRSCKEKGGNLATMKLPTEARQVEELLADAERRGSRAKVRVWIGLQRQPRQCSATRPLRGFSWTTGDQDTQYTNWLREDSPSTCSAPRCVVTTHSTTSHEARDNYKWLDGSCSLPVDGFLCRFIYEKGMCQPIPDEGGAGPVMYSTPFHLLSTRLTHIPFGSMATVPCLDGTKGDQSVLCLSKEDGTAGWHQDGPFCMEPPQSWCQDGNGGCQHLCVEANDHYYCECHQEFQLAEDRHTCIPLNPCQDAPCKYECVPSAEGYRCTCPDGYKLAPDTHTCLDEDECLAFPCEQACENSAGSYTCHCHLGFIPLTEDPTRCQDVDECHFQESCEQMCVNYIGGFQCHCREGYELQPDYSSCKAVPNLEESPTAAPSFPWLSSLPENAWLPQVPEFPDQSSQLPVGDWPTETIPQDWLTDQPHLEGLPTDHIWSTDVPMEQEWEQVKKEEQLEQDRNDKKDREDELEKQEEQYRPREEDREEEHERQQEPYRPDRPEEEHRVDGHDSQQEPYRPEEEDREDEHERHVEPYGQEEEDRENEHESQQEPYGLEEEDRADEHESQQEPYGQEEEDRGDELERQQEPYGLEEDDRQEEPQVDILQEEKEVQDEHEESNWSNDKVKQSWASLDQQALTTSPSTMSTPDSYEHEGIPNPTDPFIQEETPAPLSEEGFENREAKPSGPTSGPQANIVDEGFGDEEETDPDPLTPEPGTEGPPEKESNKQQSSKWLLIALLVPLCIFLVVMVVLGIVYCTRCTARARNKNNKDCYHWISGANDKAGAPGAAKV